MEFIGYVRKSIIRALDETARRKKCDFFPGAYEKIIILKRTRVRDVSKN